MRSQLLSAAVRAKGASRVTFHRGFASTPRRRANMVELTIDGKKVSIEAGSALIQACEKAGVTIPRYCYHEYVAPVHHADSMWANPRQETSYCWKLPHVSCRSRTSPEASRIVCLASTAWNGGQDKLAAYTQSKRRCHGILASKPPSRLPHLRSRWTVRLARSVNEIWRRSRSIPRGFRQASR